MAKPKKTESQCNDPKCPIHGNISKRGRMFVGQVVRAKAQKSALVEWGRKHYMKKYERYEQRRTRVQVHNPDCISAKKNDVVRIVETRPLSKTKKFAIIEKIGEVMKIEEEPLAGEEEKQEKAAKDRKPEKVEK